MNLFWQLWGCDAAGISGRPWLCPESSVLAGLRSCSTSALSFFVSFVLQTWPGFFLSEPHSFPPTMPELEFGVVWSDAQGQEVVWIYLQLLFNFQPPSEKSWCSFLEVTSLIMMNQILFWFLPCVWLLISSLGLDGCDPGLFLVLCCDLMRLFYLIWSSCLQFFVSFEFLSNRVQQWLFKCLHFLKPTSFEISHKIDSKQKLF